MKNYHFLLFGNLTFKKKICNQPKFHNLTLYFPFRLNVREIYVYEPESYKSKKKNGKFLVWIKMPGFIKNEKLPDDLNYFFVLEFNKLNLQSIKILQSHHCIFCFVLKMHGKFIFYEPE